MAATFIYGWLAHYCHGGFHRRSIDWSIESINSVDGNKKHLQIY